MSSDFTIVGTTRAEHLLGAGASLGCALLHIEQARRHLVAIGARTEWLTRLERVITRAWANARAGALQEVGHG